MRADDDPAEIQRELAEKIAKALKKAAEAQRKAAETAALAAKQQLDQTKTALAGVEQQRQAAVAAATDAARKRSEAEAAASDAVRRRGAAAYDRSFYPVGVGRQLLGILASPSRSDGLRKVTVPTLVIHGAVDPLVTVTGGRRTAEVVPGAEYLEIDDMAHDMPRPLWPVIVEAITRNVSKAGEA